MEHKTGLEDFYVIKNNKKTPNGLYDRFLCCRSRKRSC